MATYTKSDFEAYKKLEMLEEKMEEAEKAKGMPPSPERKLRSVMEWSEGRKHRDYGKPR